MITVNDIQWPAFFCGARGSYLATSVGLNSTSKRMSGFVWFLGSNFCWIAYGLSTGSTALVLQQLWFTVTSILGVIRNHREKLLSQSGNKKLLPLIDAMRQLNRSELEELAKHVREMIPNAVQA